jgi:hypothetical protein
MTWEYKAYDNQKPLETMCFIEIRDLQGSGSQIKMRNLTKYKAMENVRF